MRIKYSVSAWNSKAGEWVKIHTGDNHTEARRAYEEMRIMGHKAVYGETPIHCDKCEDSGTIESWGPDSGCKEFMIEPEVSYCECEAGQAARREMEDLADEIQMRQEIHVRFN